MHTAASTFGPRGATSTQRRARWITAMVLVAGLMAVVAAPGAAAAPAQRSTTGVMWHAQSGSGPVGGATASLVRTSSGVSATLRTSELLANHAYTVWFVAINNPAACASSPCSGPDILLNPGTDGQVTYGAGHVVGASGQTGFAVHMPVGPIGGWLPDRVFDNPLGAEIHLVLNDHGPVLAEHMPGMIHTYRGGCSDDSPFPPIFPPTALADGEPGPNECRLYQVAVFQP
jgi:hypothetical protein